MQGSFSDEYWHGRRIMQMQQPLLTPFFYLNLTMPMPFQPKAIFCLWSKDNTLVIYRNKDRIFIRYFQVNPITVTGRSSMPVLNTDFNWGLAAGGINIGNAIIGEPTPDNATEWQLEVEAYPKLSAKNYAYLAYAFSPGVYFPRSQGSCGNVAGSSCRLGCFCRYELLLL